MTDSIKKVDAEEVARAFDSFWAVYDRFREDNGLDKEDEDGEMPDMFEFCTALSDKNGRIARQAKHFEREDPKEDWPIGMTEAMSGYIVYILLMLSAYGLDIKEGMVKELNSGIKQYSGKDVIVDCN